MQAGNTSHSFGHDHLARDFRVAAVSGVIAPAVEAVALSAWRASWWLVRRVSGLPAAVRAWWARRRTVAALAALDERLLGDVGLTRGDLRSIGSGRLALDALEARRFDASAGTRHRHGTRIAA